MRASRTVRHDRPSRPEVSEVADARAEITEVNKELADAKGALEDARRALAKAETENLRRHATELKEKQTHIRQLDEYIGTAHANFADLSARIGDAQVRYHNLVHEIDALKAGLKA